MGSGISNYNTQTWGDFVGEIVLAADTATMDISNIPSGFKYLMVLITAQLENGKAATTLYMRLNADSTANHYSFLRAQAQAGSVFNTASVVAGKIYCQDIESSRSSGASCQISQLPTAWFKTFIMYGGDDNYLFTTGGNWQVASEINEITLSTASGDKFKAGSQFQVYGVK